VESQAGEDLRVSVEELGWPAAHHAVERRHPLLSIEQKFHHAGRQRAVATVVGCFGFRGPDQ
jgi:hypothetical protein